MREKPPIIWWQLSSRIVNCIKYDCFGSQIEDPDIRNFLHIFSNNPEPTGLCRALIRATKAGGFRLSNVPLTFPRLLHKIEVLPWYNDEVLPGVWLKYHHPLEVGMYLWNHPALEMYEAAALDLRPGPGDAPNTSSALCALCRCSKSFSCCPAAPLIVHAQGHKTCKYAQPKPTQLCMLK